MLLLSLTHASRAGEGGLFSDDHPCVSTDPRIPCSCRAPAGVLQVGVPKLQASGM